MGITGNYVSRNTYLYFIKVCWLVIILQAGLYSNVCSQQPETGNLSYSNYSLLKDTGVIIKQIKNAGVISDRFPDSSFRLVDQALQSSQVLHFNRGIAASFFQTGTLYFVKNEPEKAIAVLKLAIQYCDTGRSATILLVRALGNIAEAYTFLGKTDSAALFNYKALDVIKTLKIDNPDLLVNAYTRVLLFWLNLGEGNNEGTHDKYFQSAVAYLNKATLLEGTKKKTQGTILLSRGHIQAIQNHYDSARYFYHQYLEMARNGGMGRQDATINATRLNICETFIRENNGDSAGYYALLAIKDLEAKGNKTPLNFINANYYLAKAYCLQKRYNEAIATATVAIDRSKKYNITYLRPMAYATLSEAYSATGNYALAWKAESDYADARDSLMRTEKMQAISQMEMRYQVAEKNKELAEKELAISKRDNSIKIKNLWIAGIGTILISAAFISFLFYRQHQQKERIRALRAMIEGEEKERSRLARELHDGIGGSLGSIRLQLSSAIKKHVPDDPSGDFGNILLLLSDAYTELRKTSHNLMPQTLQEEGLERATALFCKGISNGNVTPVDFESIGVFPPLQPHIELTAYRIIQELVHNILKHARATHAMVQLAFVNDQLGITVEDNGVGMSGNSSPTGSGMGIKTIRERVKIMGGQFEISSSPGAGTSINLLFRID